MVRDGESSSDNRITSLDINLPPALGGDWYDIRDYLSRDDEINEAMLKILMYQSRLLEEMIGIQRNNDNPNMDDSPLPQALRLTSSLEGVPIENDSFEEISTDGEITVDPGQREEIVKWDPEPHGLLWEVGTTDADKTDYRWLVNGDNLMVESLRNTLGIYKDPYRFANPILVRDGFIVEVTRDEDATDPQSYVSKLRGMPISDDLYLRLKDIWEV